MNYNVYGRKLIKLPTPQFIVFYNGRENQPDEKELRLSDAFMPVNDKEPMLECKVRMLNINYGHNEKILKASKRLNDYSYVTIQYLHSYVQKSMQNLLRKWIFACLIYIFLRHSQ